MIAIVYFLAGKAGLLLAFQHPSASALWPPSGIALTACLLLGRRVWPAVFAGAFFVNITTYGTVWTSLGIAVGNTIEAVTCSLLMEIFAEGRNFYRRGDNVLRFTLCTLLCAIISAVIGLAVLSAAGLVPDRHLSVFTTWWLGDVGGLLGVTPILVILWLQPARKWTMPLAIEALIVCLVITSLNMFFFTSRITPGITHYRLAFVCFLPILWIGVRMGPKETMGATFLLCTTAVVATLRQVGPFFVNDANASLLLLQVFMIVASALGLLLSSAMLERRASEEALEQKVRERTRELEQAREQDRANFQRLRSTILHMPVGALLMNAHGNILELNDAYCRLFHIEASPSLRQDKVFRQFHSMLAAPEQHTERVHKAIEAREPIVADDSRLMDGRVVPQDFLPISEDGVYHGLLFLYRDVTKERRSDRAKSEFMSLASHQLRTPLTAIRWSLSRLQRELAGRMSESEEYVLREGQQGVARMSETINAMLRISRVESENTLLKSEEVDLSELLRKKESLFRDQCARRKQTFTIDTPDSLRIKTDVICLREIVMNLLQNAVKYTPDGGSISLIARDADDRVVIEVKDTGYGIPLHQQKLVFQKFFRGDNIVSRDTTGTGLGLYLVALLTKALGGDIQVTSRENEGSVFTLSLPKALEEEKIAML